MKRHFFQWDSFSKEREGLVFPADLLEDIFLLDVQNEKIWLSKQCAELLFGDEEVQTEISCRTFEQHLSEEGCHAFLQEIQRLRAGKVSRASCHAALQSKSGDLSSMIYLYCLKDCRELLGHISVDLEPTREYDQHLEQVIQKLRHAQTVNELIVEGASDYIYQLDLVNNVCTFSSKALDVLPLESPAFSDAMNRILSFIIQEDRQIFLDSFIPFLTGKSDRHRAEYRVLTKQGNIMWISCQGKGIHDDQGRPVMIAGSLLDITEQKKHEEEINHMLYYDMLTGLKNRLCFEKDMEERKKESGARGCLLYMDIRRFKLYNEMFGHSFGDKVLKEFSYMLNLYFSNAAGIYRYSGDEFLVHLHETDRSRIMARLMPFMSVLKKIRELDGHSLYLNTCIAVVLYPEHGYTVEELMNHANQCLYRMNREGKDAISFFAGQTDSISRQFLLENELRKDVENNFRHLRVVFQPIVRLKGDRSGWIGAETLLRYSNPAFSDLEQMEMIRTLEYSGLIIPIGRWVLARAIHECSRWNHAGNNSIVHVNIAAQQVSDVGLVKYIREKCEEEGFPPSHLIIELTETSLLNNFELATQFCKELMQMGIGVALDDFGTGYSSFNYLKNLPISEIKVDHEYVQNLPENHYNQTIISCLYHLSQDLNLELCVEGVETEEELEILKNMGISLIQGYYFERPMEYDVIRREFPNKILPEVED